MEFIDYLRLLTLLDLNVIKIQCCFWVYKVNLRADMIVSRLKWTTIIYITRFKHFSCSSHFTLVVRSIVLFSSAYLLTDLFNAQCLWKKMFLLPIPYFMMRLWEISVKVHQQLTCKNKNILVIRKIESYVSISLKLLVI